MVLSFLLCDIGRGVKYRIESNYKLHTNQGFGVFCCIVSVERLQKVFTEPMVTPCF